MMLRAPRHRRRGRRLCGRRRGYLSRVEVYIRTDGRICYGSLHIPDREVMIALRGVGSPSVNGLGFKIKRRLKGECFDYYGLFERQQETLYFKQILVLAFHTINRIFT